jgi:Glycosyltransferases involved in cell wall biogenesis
MKISIITINRNNESGLKRTIESVISQSLTDFEYIIIDGASTDGSKDVIKQYEDKITYWVSEPDSGIYQAMNKGIQKATGEYCLFLNSGDYLVDGAVLSDFSNIGFSEDIVSGNMMLVFDNGSTCLWESETVDEFSFEAIYKRSLPHQATFIKTKLFDQYGDYNEQNKIVSDREFFLKVLIVENVSYAHFNRLVSYYNMNGISAQSSMTTIHEQELAAMYSNHIPQRIFKSYEKNWTEMSNQRPIVREYMNLKNGKTAPIIKLLLKIKSKIKK